jgi:hypothetical protein
MSHHHLFISQHADLEQEATEGMEILLLFLAWPACRGGAGRERPAETGGSRKMRCVCRGVFRQGIDENRITVQLRAMKNSDTR